MRQCIELQKLMNSTEFRKEARKNNTSRYLFDFRSNPLGIPHILVLARVLASWKHLHQPTNTRIVVHLTSSDMWFHYNIPKRCHKWGWFGWKNRQLDKKDPKNKGALKMNHESIWWRKMGFLNSAGFQGVSPKRFQSGEFVFFWKEKFAFKTRQFASL